MPADDALAKKLAPDPEQARVVTGERSVVSVCSDGDDFTVLYHRYKLDLWRLASFWLGDRDEAEDVVQETFLRALRALREARRAPDAMRAWLLTICRNACTDRLRARRRREGVVAGSLDAPGALDGLAAGAGTGGDGAVLLDVRRALAGMEREEAEAFLLVDVMGLHSDEAARVLGLRAASTLRSRLARARAAIVPVLVEPDGRRETPGPVHGAPELWGLLHAPPSQAVVVAFGGGRRRPFARVHARVRDGAELGLLRFFEGLDGAIPAGSSVVAVVEDGDGGWGDGAGRWVASHPRWELQWAPTHDRWLSEVEALLARCPARGAHEHERMRLLLGEERPFVWTYGR